MFQDESNLFGFAIAALFRHLAYSNEHCLKRALDVQNLKTKETAIETLMQQQETAMKNAWMEKLNSLGRCTKKQDGLFPQRKQNKRNELCVETVCIHGAWLHMQQYGLRLATKCLLDATWQG